MLIMSNAIQLDIPVESPAPTGDLSTRAAGWGAITFAIVVILQNLIRGASAPTNGATGTKVLAHYSGSEATTFVLVATYVLSGIGLAVFLGGIARPLLASGRPGWARTGIMGGISIMA